jgi:hypothetical protein
MTILTRDRNTPSREGDEFVFPMAANVTIFAGGLTMLNAAGDATPGRPATGQIACGVAQETKVNGAVIGAETIRVRRGVFRFSNSAAADLITKAHIGDPCFIVDDDQVALTNGTNTRSQAGTIVDVDAQGVWVRIGF